MRYALHYDRDENAIAKLLIYFNANTHRRQTTPLPQ